LSHALRQTDTVARLGGDEFCIIQTNIKNPSDTAALCDKLLGLVGTPMKIEGRETKVETSIGIAVYPGGKTNAEDLVRQADLALYRSKEQGRNRFSFFDQELSVNFERQVSLIHALRSAIEHNDLLLHYQPQVDNSNGHIVGVEALVRWQHAERGLIAPGEFISIAEKSGLIHTLGAWVFREACRQCALWEKHGCAPESLAVNISSAQFTRPGFAEQLVNIIEQEGCDPRRIEIEITESIFLQDIDEVARDLGYLESHQLRFSIDDFGTGYSSLQYLKRLPVYKLKIDREFVRNVTFHGNDREIVRASIDLCSNLGLTCIAEGVETEEQWRHISAMGCPLSQGYLFCHPKPASDIEALLHAGTIALPGTI